MISTLEAAKLLGISSIRVRDLIYDGALPARKIGRSWVLNEEDVMNRLSQHPRSGRPRKTTVQPSVASDTHTPSADSHAHDLYRACKNVFEKSPSVEAIQALEDPEEAAFRIAIADFFLQRKQAELVQQGVF